MAAPNGLNRILLGIIGTVYRFGIRCNIANGNSTCFANYLLNWPPQHARNSSQSCWKAAWLTKLCSFPGVSGYKIFTVLIRKRQRVDYLKHKKCMTSELVYHLAIIQLWPVVNLDNVMNTWHIKKLRLFMQKNLFPSKVLTLLGESSVCNHRSEIGWRFTLWIHIYYTCIYLNHPKVVVNLSSHTIPTYKLQHQYTLTGLH